MLFLLFGVFIIFTVSVWWLFSGNKAYSKLAIAPILLFGAYIAYPFLWEQFGFPLATGLFLLFFFGIVALCVKAVKEVNAGETKGGEYNRIGNQEIK